MLGLIPGHHRCVTALDCRTVPKRAGVVRFGVHAGDKREKLQDQIIQTNQVLAQAAEAVQARLIEHQSQRQATQAGSDWDLWSKQQTLWKREMERWERERAAWDAKETRLLDQISKLHDVVLDLSMRTQASSLQAHTPAPPPANVESSRGGQATQSVAESQASPGPQQQQTPPPPPPRPQQQSQPVSVADMASQFLPPDDPAFVPVTPEDYAPLSMDNSGSLLDRSVDNVREAMQAAFSAVDAGDVLDASFEQLGRSSPASSSQVQQSAAHSSNDEPQMREQAGSGPPSISLGCDDIFWMSKLHGGLMQASLYPGEEDIENWLFGESTMSALLTYQAINGLPETGVVDDGTWRKLLGEEYNTLKAPTEPEGTPSAADTSFPGAYNTMGQGGGKSAEPEDELTRVRSLRENSELSNRKRNNFTDKAPRTQDNVELDSWPLLREGDGGRSVHYLQVALEKQGFISDTDDQQWWMFGSSTYNCVLMAQACNGLPETGVVDANTWRALMGQDATPASLAGLSNEFEDDLTDSTDAIWLLGEQRWERRKKV